MIDEKQKEWYQKEISNELQIDIEELWFYFQEIQTYCEYDVVLEAIISCNEITTHNKKSRNTHRDEEQFNTIQKKFKKQCEKFGIPFVEKKFEYRTKFYYEDLLKNKKQLLLNILHNDCHTGLNRAAKISKILEEI